MPPRVILLSPNVFSDYSIAVAELLHRRGVVVEKILVRKMANLGRIRGELRTHGAGALVKKVARKLLFRRLAYSAATFETIAAFRVREGIAFRSLYDFARERSSVVESCSDLNDPNVCALIAASEPDAVVFTGGGLLRRPLLEAARWRIVNGHPGILPFFRGVDCLEWAAFAGRPTDMGVTIHLMDEGVDTGPLLEVERVRLLPSDTTFDDYRGRLEPITCHVLARAVARYVSGDLVPVEQRREDGRQFFAMHPAIRELAAARLRAELKG